MRWYPPTMRATIDGGGRVVVPKPVRDRLGLQAGSEVEIIERDGSVEIAPVATPMTLADDEPVAVTDREMPVLTAEMVRRTLESLRR